MRHGRIPGAKNRKPAKTNPISVRLTPEIYQKIKHLNVANYIRSLIEKDVKII